MQSTVFFSITALLSLLIAAMPYSPRIAAQEKSESSVAKQANQDQEATDAEKSGKDDKKKVATVEVELKPIVVYEAFDGIFESTQMHEIKTDFEAWTDLKVESVVEEGSAVSAGQELLKFDTDSIEKAIAEAEFAVSNSAFDLETARLKMKEVNETYELDQAIAERSWKNAQQDYEYYQQVQLPQRLDDIDYSEKSAGYFLEYSQDELDQLEQMYTEDELTEESEEIVLKRQRRSVESAKRAKDRAMQRVKRDREINVPREKVQQEEFLKRAEMSHVRSTITLPINKQKAEIGLAQAAFSHANKEKNLAEIRADQKKMKLVAPADGILYYGRCVRGKWVGGQGSAARRIEPNKKIQPNSIVMTIVDVGKMMIRASLDESKLASLTPRMRGKALIKAAANQVVPATIKSISRIPLDNGKFDCQIVVEDLPADASVMPGMGCKLSFLVYENKQAVVAPKASVFSDDGGVTHYVYVVDGEEVARQEVTVGLSSGNNVEITKGLTAGDKISKAKP